eukprot:g7023.t1
MGGGFVDDEQPLLPNGGKGPWQILDGIINHCGFGRTQTQLFILCSLVNFIEAMVTALVPLLFPLLKKEWQVDNAQLALLGSAISIGMLVGALLLGKSSDLIGRKLSMMICLVTILVFGFGSAFAPSMSVMAGLQLLLGVGYGGNIVISTTYLCEFLPKNVRGMALTIVAFFFGVGGMTCVALGMHLIPILGWRKMLMLTITPIFPAIVLLMMSPESPRYYLHTHQTEKVVEVLNEIANVNGVPLPDDLIPTKKNMLTRPSRCSKAGDKKSFSKQLQDPTIYKTLIPLVGCWFFNAFGCNIFAWVPLYISESPVMNSGATDPMQNAYFAAFYMSLGDALGTLFVALCFGANFGRRILLMALLFVVGALTFSLGRLQNVQIMLAVLPVAKAMSQATAVLYTYTPEVFPTSFRVNGLAMCSIVHRFAPVVAPYLAAALMKYSFAHVTTAFGGLYLCGSVSSLFLSVETAGRDVVEDGTKGGDERDFMLISELCRCRVAGMPGAPGGSGGIAHTGEKDKNEYASDSV